MMKIIIIIISRFYAPGQKVQNHFLRGRHPSSNGARTSPAFSGAAAHVSHFGVGLKHVLKELFLSSYRP